MHDYIIIRAGSTDELSKKVNEKYSEGYFCVGGLAVDSWEAGVEYLQAMYKYTNDTNVVSMWTAHYQPYEGNDDLTGTNKP